VTYNDKPRELKKFPSTLLVWEEYDGGKALVAFLFLVSSIYFLSGALGVLIKNIAWLHDLIVQPNPLLIEAPSNWWELWKHMKNNPFSYFANSVISLIDLAFRFSIFFLTYCLAWKTFDPRNIEGYVLGITNILIGGSYFLFPVDLIPDIVPIAGMVDDVILGVGMVLIGSSGWYQAYIREMNTKTIIQMLNKENYGDAMDLLLKDKGISVKEWSKLI
jgi:uncharacterized membrane protein YkvA (DUF1232 family)